MDKKQILSFAKDYLEDAKLMQIASCSNNQPWIATCWFAVDKNWDFYFISNKARRHSEEIRNNEKVACTIIQDGYKGLGDTIQGIQIQGIAKEVSGLDSAKAYMIYLSRWHNFADHVKKPEYIKGITATKIYRIRPTQLVWFDELNFKEDPRQVVNFENY